MGMPLSMSEFQAEDLDSVVRRAKNGSHDAFAELVRLYQQDVRSFICRQLGCGSTADDIAQDVFVQAFRSIATYREQGAVRSWLLGIARNLVVSHLRRKVRRNSISLVDLVDRLQAAEREEDPSDMEWQLQQIDVLRGCVKQLSEQQQRIIESFYFENIPATAIARQMQRKPGTIRMTLLRVREVLRRCVEQKTNS
ncbi:MAG: RNA polymerase sigma factor [Aureliella sp.]